MAWTFPLLSVLTGCSTWVWIPLDSVSWSLAWPWATSLAQILSLIQSFVVLAFAAWFWAQYIIYQVFQFKLSLKPVKLLCSCVVMCVYIYIHTSPNTNPKIFCMTFNLKGKKKSKFKSEYLYCQISQFLLGDYHLKCKIAAFQSKWWISYSIYKPKKIMC